MKFEDDNFGEMEGMELEMENNGNESMMVEMDQFVGLPKTVFACNVHESVFKNEHEKHKFQFLFQRFGSSSFVYLPSFRRVRVTYNSSEEAADAKISLHQTVFNGQTLELYFAQVKTPDEENTPTSLLPPKPDKQFLISPPASPPIGWEPIEENKPAFNFDLLSAVVNMVPGQVHELHRGANGTPSVVVHVCEDLSTESSIRIPQTRRPGT